MRRCQEHVTLVVLLLATAITQTAAAACVNSTKSFSYNYAAAPVQYPLIRVESPSRSFIAVDRGENMDGMIEVKMHLIHTPTQEHAQVTQVISETAAGSVPTIVALLGSESTETHPTHSGGSSLECARSAVNVTLPSNRNSAGEFCVTTELSKIAEGIQVLLIKDTCVSDEESLQLGNCQLSGYTLPACEIPLHVEFTASATPKYINGDGCTTVPSRRLQSAQLTLKDAYGKETDYSLREFTPDHCGNNYKVPFRSLLAAGDFTASLKVTNAKGAVKTIQCPSFKHLLPQTAIPPKNVDLCWGGSCTDFSYLGNYDGQKQSGVSGVVRIPNSPCKPKVSIGLSSNPFCSKMDVLPMSDVDVSLPSFTSKSGLTVQSNADSDLDLYFSYTPHVSSKRPLKQGSGYYLRVVVKNGLGETSKCFSKAFVL